MEKVVAGVGGGGSNFQRAKWHEEREEAEMLAGGKVGAKKEAALVNGGGLDLLAVTSWQAPHTKNADAFSVVGMPC